MPKKTDPPRLVDEGDDAPSYVLAIMQSVEMMSRNTQLSIESLREEIRQNRDAMERRFSEFDDRVKKKIEEVKTDLNNVHCQKDDKFQAIDREIRDVKNEAKKLETEYDQHMAETGKAGWKTVLVILGFLSMIAAAVFGYAQTHDLARDNHTRVVDLEKKHRDVTVPRLAENVIEHGRMHSDITNLQQDIKSVRIRSSNNTQDIAVMKVRLDNSHRR
jgi:hypothetical protein